MHSAADVKNSTHSRNGETYQGKEEAMKALTDPRATCTVIGISVIALLALASPAGAMQEYEDLKTLVAEVEPDNNADGGSTTACTWVLVQIQRISQAASAAGGKVKAYIKSKGMMTSSEAAVARPRANRRSTVKAQDL